MPRPHTRSAVGGDSSRVSPSVRRTPVTSTSTAPVSSLSSLPSPAAVSPSIPAAPPSTHAVTSTSARALFTPPRSKHCPVCNKDIAKGSFSNHINSRTCGQNLSDPAAALLSYERCRHVDCGRWYHVSKIAQHIDTHKPTMASRRPHVPSPLRTPPSLSQSSPPSPTPSTPLSLSPPGTPPQIRDTGPDHKDSDVDTEPDDIADTPDTSLLPDSYKTWPHLFLYVPNKARELWVQTCSQLLGEIHSLYLQHDIAPQVDKVIYDFLQLPRLFAQTDTSSLYAAPAHPLGCGWRLVQSFTLGPPHASNIHIHRPSVIPLVTPVTCRNVTIDTCRTAIHSCRHQHICPCPVHAPPLQTLSRVQQRHCQG